MGYSVGVDLVEIARIQQTLDRFGERFLSRVFTPAELAETRRPDGIAARFAGKEAVAKALGTGFGSVNWRDIEILRGSGGRPWVRLGGKALEVAQQAGITTVAISLSHGRDLAVAFAVAGAT